MQNHFDIRGPVTVIYLNLNGKVFETLIDTEDLKRVQEFPNTWFIRKTTVGPYVFGRYFINRHPKRIWLHRFIMNTPDDLVVDHIDHYTLDNRKKNLRNVTSSENASNRIDVKTNNIKPLSHTGIHKHRNGFRVRIMVKGVRHDLGVYRNFDEAVNVAESFRKQIS